MPTLGGVNAIVAVGPPLAASGANPSDPTAVPTSTDASTFHPCALPTKFGPIRSGLPEQSEPEADCWFDRVRIDPVMKTVPPFRSTPAPFSLFDVLSTKVENEIAPKGLRLLRRVNSLPKELASRIANDFGGLARLQRATIVDLMGVEGVDESIATSVKDTLERVTENTILDQYS